VEGEGVRRVYRLAGLGIWEENCMPGWEGRCFCFCFFSFGSLFVHLVPDNFFTHSSSFLFFFLLFVWEKLVLLPRFLLPFFFTVVQSAVCTFNVEDGEFPRGSVIEPFLSLRKPLFMFLTCILE